MRDVQIIIWDEISMTSKHAYEAVDRLLRFICSVDIPLGNKYVIISVEIPSNLVIYGILLNI